MPLFNPTANIYPATTTVNGTTSSIICSEPLQAVGFKVVFINISSTFASVGGVSYTYPVPFTTVAAATNVVTGVVLTVSTTSVTVTVASALGSQALMVIMGY